MKILFVVNHPTFFISHRLDLALQARKKGFEVFLATGDEASKAMSKESSKTLKNNNINFFSCGFSSSGLSVNEIFGFLRLLKIIIKIKPDLIHLVSPKGILYGGIIARILRVPKVVVSVSGMGFIFTNLDTNIRRCLSFIFLKFLKIVVNHKKCAIIVQNNDDKRLFERVGRKADSVNLIPGSGVDLKKFDYKPHSFSEKKVIFPSRLLYNKGIKEFVEAASVIKKLEPDWKFLLVGASDYKSPDAVSQKDLSEWIESNNIEWLGHQTEMSSIYSMAGIVCLPTYREGMPLSLLEAAAVGRPVITTDVIGAREAIVNQVTGELVQVKSSYDLVEKILKLIRDPILRENYGNEGRKLAELKFAKDKIISMTLEVYDNL